MESVTHFPAGEFPRAAFSGRIEAIKRGDKVGSIIKKWPPHVGHSFQGMIKNKRLGPARLKLDSIEAVKSIDQLGPEALRGLFDFIRHENSPTAMALVASQRVLDAFPVVTGFSYENMRRFLNAVALNAPSYEITGPGFMGLLSECSGWEASLILCAAQEAREGGISALCSEEMKRFLKSERKEDFNPGPLVLLFRAVAIRGNTDLLSPRFIDEIAPAGDRVKDKVLRTAKTGTSLGKLIFLARMSRLKQQTGNKELKGTGTALPPSVIGQAAAPPGIALRA